MIKTIGHIRGDRWFLHHLLPVKQQTIIVEHMLEQRYQLIQP
jgi:hypothetical protein